MKYYYKVISEDNETFNLVKIRHDAYLTYRTNRKSLIKQLNDVAGLVKQKGKKDYVEVFDYFNDACAKVPFYSNKDENGNVTINNIPNLHQWFYRNVSGVTQEVNDSTRVEFNYSAEECAKVFNKYEYCRKMIFKIFNMITSSSKMNGYDKWHNILDTFCQADLRDIQMEKLYNAANTEDDFIPTDDQQQVMDDRAWNEKGIYESWFSDEMRRYNEKIKKQKKSDIVKIDMKDPAANACKVITNGKAVFAGCTFYPGDIVEICPTRIIDKSSLYSKDMREIVFEVIPNREWVLPFGYCQYYDIQSDRDQANCDFIWDPIARVIVIKAINKINKHEKLILNNKK